jgi:hypothetical protein
MNNLRRGLVVGITVAVFTYILVWVLIFDWLYGIVTNP